MVVFAFWSQNIAKQQCIKYFLNWHKHIVWTFTKRNEIKNASSGYEIRIPSRSIFTHNLYTCYLIKSIWTPTRNCNLTFPVTHFPVVDINTRWAHPLALWQLELCEGDFLPGVWMSLVESQHILPAELYSEQLVIWGVGVWSEVDILIHPHKCSMGFRSGLWAGQSISGTLLSTNHSLTDLA
jgi:hypothetical protein